MNPCNRIYQYALDKLRFRPLAAFAAWGVRTVFRLPLALSRPRNTPFPDQNRLEAAHRVLTAAWPNPLKSNAIRALPAVETVDISVIVPAYNAGLYIDECIQSVLTQNTTASFEIIVIDDGSTDDTGARLDRLAALDARVHITHGQNVGLASARNAALERANGRYVTFLDADDALLPGALEAMYTCAVQTNADLVHASWRYMDGPRQIFPHQVLAGSDVIAISEINGVAWGKLFRRSLFEAIRFPEGFTSYEDTIIKYLVLRSSRTVATIPFVAYAWRKTPGGITTTTKNTLRAVQTYWSIEACEQTAQAIGLPDTHLSAAILTQQIAMSMSRLVSLTPDIRHAAFDQFRALIRPKLQTCSVASLPFPNRIAAHALLQGDFTRMERIARRWMLIA